MPAVSEAIVREYFELNGFLVRQLRKYVAPAVRDDDDIDFLVLNPNPHPGAAERPFLLRSQDLPAVERAVVILNRPQTWRRSVSRRVSPATCDQSASFSTRQGVGRCTKFPADSNVAGHR